MGDSITYNINLNGDGLSSTATTAAAGGIIGFALAAGLAIGILLIIAGWKIFEKAGEKGWKILIPIYDLYILFKICGVKNWFWAFLGASIFTSILMCINPPVTETLTYTSSSITFTDLYDTIDWSQHVPYLVGLILSAGVSIAASILLAVRLAKAFGKGAGFTLGLIFLSGIFYLILAFGQAKYDKKAVNA